MPNVVNSTLQDGEVSVDENDEKTVAYPWESSNEKLDSTTKIGGSDVSGVEHVGQKWKLQIKDVLDNKKNEKLFKSEHEIELDNTANQTNQIDIKSKPENPKGDTITEQASFTETAHNSFTSIQIGNETTKLAITNDISDNTNKAPELKLSPRSTSSSKYEMDFSEVVMPPKVQEKADVFTPEDSWIRVAIPFLPLGVAIVCLLMNIVLPGSGNGKLFLNMKRAL
ncbi:hypothetical protein DPMN_022405 [Dreissena polymorpha]|uniref:Uncharacterized protein n=1 Tax=Dreissena polymorpha TaxID=45954 RepID=A0A9D4SAS4_DREPO|nr:hypothetical protein DPMN_022405 [Dreissena polymorpha]